MKKTKLLFGTLILAAGFVACNDSNDTKRDVDNLAQYVDSVDKMDPVYTTAKWTEIETGYADREARVEKNASVLQAEEKQRADETRARFTALKGKYEMKMKETEEAAKKPDYRMVLRTNLFGEGKIGTDMGFNWVTANNIKDVYDRFVTTVDDNKDKYTREDWDEIKVLYEALDNRKNEVEKDLATKDNMKIAGMKIKFASIKSVERPSAKLKENEKSK
ncbi:MAG: DUF6565 domain-containing protein, partial [Ferruginibacter sp.]